MRHHRHLVPALLLALTAWKAAAVEAVVTLDDLIQGQQIAADDLARFVRDDAWPELVTTAGKETQVAAGSELGNGSVRQRAFAVQMPDGRDFIGTIVIPQPASVDDLRVKPGKRKPFLAIPVRMTASALASHANADKCRHILAQHYQDLLAQQLPGTAWFRHQLSQFDSNTNPSFSQQRQHDLMGLFTGSRAVSENLRLDRNLGLDEQDVLPHATAGVGQTYVVVKPGDTAESIAQRANITAQELARLNDWSVWQLTPGQILVVPAADPKAPAPTALPERVPVAIADLPGITVRAFDWQPLIKNLPESKDALAAFIPADQHAIFFPSFASLTTVLDRADSLGTPILHAFESRAEDALCRERYQKQMCLEMTELARRFGPMTIANIAITGGDPYLRTGSDVAVLFQAKQPAVLKGFLAAKLTAAATAGATTVNGTSGGIAWTGVVTPDRSVSAYLMTLRDDVLVVANSTAQLDRLAAVVSKKAAPLLNEPEFRFFRHRHPAHEGSALLVLSDATIRRWASPAVRIADSRRTRAAAVLAELHARHVDELARNTTVTDIPLPTDVATRLGAITWTSGAMRSATFGDLRFMTPIDEMALTTVTADEAAAYTRWRNDYQRAWSNAFDPIALEITPDANGISTDLTVMPITTNSGYRDFLELARNAKLAATAGGYHGELLHLALALDLRSQMGRQASGFLSQMSKDFGTDPLAWMGSSVHLSLEGGAPLDAFIAKAMILDEKSSKEWSSLIPTLPLALRADCTNSLKMAAFLAGVHAYVDSSAPNLTLWETRKHGAMSYVRVSRADAGQATGDPMNDWALYYIAAPDALVLSLNETMITDFIDRRARKDKPVVKSWQGDHVALRLGSSPTSVLRLIRTMSPLRPETIPTAVDASWANLPILNEWHRLFPDLDPVVVHERVFGVRLVCPSGGQYRWNAELGTMESTVYGSPLAPTSDAPEWPTAITNLTGADFGLTFENNGVRVKMRLDSKPATAPSP